MATASVTYTFTPGSEVVAAETNQNFTDLVNFIQTNCIQKDGSLAATSVLSGPSTDPSSDNHLSRKAYVDKKAGRVLGQATDAAFVVNTGDSVWQDITDATVTVDLKQNRWYQVVLYIEDSGASAAGTYTVTSRVLQDGTELCQANALHVGGGQGVTLIAMKMFKHTAADDAGVVFKGQVTQRSGSTTNVSANNAQIFVIDHGIDA